MPSLILKIIHVTVIAVQIAPTGDFNNIRIKGDKAAVEAEIVVFHSRTLVRMLCQRRLPEPKPALVEQLHRGNLRLAAASER
jgi:hypothetical protein